LHPVECIYKGYGNAVFTTIFNGSIYFSSATSFGHLTISGGKHNTEKPSLTTDPQLLDHLSYLLISESLTEVNTKDNTRLPTLFENP
jgi:hypothetical protein